MSGVGNLKPHFGADVKVWSRLSRPAVSRGRNSLRMRECRHRRMLELSRHSGTGGCPGRAQLPLRTGTAATTTAKTYANDPLINAVYFDLINSF